ncbi:hypothetical protein [Bacillus paranthracis]
MLGILVLILGLFTIHSLKKTSAYKSNKYDYFLLGLLTLEVLVLQISAVL